MKSFNRKGGTEMTDKELAKRMSELCDAFKEMCQARDCEGCEMEAYAKEGVCCHAWIWKRLRAETCGTMDVCPAAQKEAEAAAAPNESPKAKEEDKLPKWCKVGQWVLINNTLCKISEVNDDPYSPFTVKDVYGKCMFAHPRVICPVRFRSYTYEEAKGLLGKTMECERNGKHSAYLVTAVQEFSGHVEINGYPHSWLAEKFNATIDGVPIGVPEVDVEAMKGGAE
jgi:hypothetical protein